MGEQYDPAIDSELVKSLEAHIDTWRNELYELLPGVSEDLEIDWDNRWLISNTGTGGATLTKHRIALSFDPKFEGDKAEQIADLKGSYYHEAFHTVQGWTFEDTKGKEISAIEEAIYEGAATVFERERAGTEPLWGAVDDEDTMHKWLDEIRRLPLDYDSRKYKFYDPDTGRRWILYRVGTYIVYRTLRNNPELRVENIATKGPHEILSLAKL